MTNILTAILIFLPILIFFIYVVETNKIEKDLKVIIFLLGFIIYTGLLLILTTLN